VQAPAWLQHDTPESGTSLRYIGSLVAIFTAICWQGGVFYYPEP
jgi:fructose-1,6-bisphosphatase